MVFWRVFRKIAPIRTFALDPPPSFFIDPLLVNRHVKKDLTPEHQQDIVDCSLQDLKRDEKNSTSEESQFIIMEARVRIILQRWGRSIIQDTVQEI